MSRINEIVRYECPICGEEYNTKTEAYFCCFDNNIDLVSLTNRSFIIEVDCHYDRTIFECTAHVKHLDESIYVTFQYNLHESDESAVSLVLELPPNVDEMNDDDMCILTEFLIESLNNMFSHDMKVVISLKDDDDIDANIINARLSRKEDDEDKPDGYC